MPTGISGMGNVQIGINLIVNERQARRQLSTFDKALSGIGKTARNAISYVAGRLIYDSLQGMDRFVESIGESIGEYERLGKVIRVAQAREIELASRGTEDAISLRQAYEQAGGGVQSYLNAVRDIALTRPVTEEHIADVFRTLAGYQLGTKRSMEFTKALADYSVTTGRTSEEVWRLSLAIGQIQAKGKLAGEEMRQLTNAGITQDLIIAGLNKLYPELGVNLGNFYDLMRSGDLKAGYVLPAMLDQLEQFEGLGKEVAKTWYGIPIMFGNISRVMKRTLFAPAFAELAKPIAAFIDLWDFDKHPNTLKGLESMGEAMGKLLKDPMEWLAREGLTSINRFFIGLSQGKTIVDKLGNALSNALTGVTTNQPYTLSSIWKTYLVPGIEDAADQVAGVARDAGRLVGQYVVEGIVGVFTADETGNLLSAGFDVLAQGFIGTTEGVARGIGKAILGKDVDVTWEEGWAGWAKFFSDLGIIVTYGWDRVTETFDTGVESWRGIGDNIAAIARLVADNVKLAFDKFIGSVQDGVTGWITFRDSILGASQWLRDQVMFPVREIGNYLNDHFVPILLGIARIFIGPFKVAAALVYQALSAIYNLGIRPVTASLQQLGDTLTPIAIKALDFARGLLGIKASVDDTAGSIAQQLNPAVGQADGIISFLTASWEFFATTLGTAKNIMSDQVSVALDRMQAQLSGIIWVARLIVSGIQAMANAFTRSLDIIGETLNDTGDAFDMVTQKILNINWGETVGKKANEVAEKAKELGRNLVTGVSDGIKSAVTEVEKTAKGLGNAVLDILGITWDIKSPSKETFAMGKEGIDKGLELGLLAGIPGIKAAVQVMGLETLSALDTYLYIPFMSKMSSLVPYTGGGSAWANLPPGTPWPVQQTLPTQNKTTGEWSGLYMGMQPLVDALDESGQKADGLGDDMQDAAVKIQAAMDKFADKIDDLIGIKGAEEYGVDYSYMSMHMPASYGAQTGFVDLVGEGPDKYLRQISDILAPKGDAVNKESPFFKPIMDMVKGTKFEIPEDIINKGGAELRASIMRIADAATKGDPELAEKGFINVDGIITKFDDNLKTNQNWANVQVTVANKLKETFGANALLDSIFGPGGASELSSQGITIDQLITNLGMPSNVEDSKLVKVFSDCGVAIERDLKEGFSNAKTGVDQFVTHSGEKRGEVEAQWDKDITFKIIGEVEIGGASVGGGSGGSGLNPNQGPGGTGGVIGMQRGGTLWTRGAGSGDTIPFFAMLAPRERLTVMPRREVMTSGGGVSKVLNIHIGSINTGMDEALLKHRVQQWAFEG